MSKKQLLYIMSLPVIEAPSSSSQINNIFVQQSAITPSGAYLAIHVDKTQLFTPSGIKYNVTQDASGLMSWVGVSSACVNTAVLASAMQSACWYMPSGYTTIIDSSFTFNGATKTTKFVPTIANEVIGVSGISKHLLLTNANAYGTSISKANAFQIFGNSLSSIDASLTSTLQTDIKNALETSAAQNALLQGIVNIAGPVLNISSAGVKYYTVSSAVPDFVIRANLSSASLDYKLPYFDSYKRLQVNNIPISISMLSVPLPDVSIDAKALQSANTTSFSNNQTIVNSNYTLTYSGVTNATLNTTNPSVPGLQFPGGTSSAGAFYYKDASGNTTMNMNFVANSGLTLFYLVNVASANTDQVAKSIWSSSGLALLNAGCRVDASNRFFGSIGSSSFMPSTQHSAMDNMNLGVMRVTPSGTNLVYEIFVNPMCGADVTKNLVDSSGNAVSYPLSVSTSLTSFTSQTATWIGRNAANSSHVNTRMLLHEFRQYNSSLSNEMINMIIVQMRQKWGLLRQPTI